MRKIIYLLFILGVFTNYTFSQTAPFDIYIEPFNISGLGGLQSYAYGQNNGKWLIIGGRLDGLHRRQPFVSFDLSGNNNQLIVVDPLTRQKWSSNISSLPVSIQEQISATNMEFHQDGNLLYILGGYGYNAATASKITFGKLTAIDVPSVIDAIIVGSSIVPYFRQIDDIQFAVTGGHLKKINDTYYLIGGNKFDGNYNPMGGASFTQVYTDAIRKFKIIDNGTSISINHLSTITDVNQLHRRDYNAVAQIMPDGSEGITVYSGVFQPNADLPFLNCVNIDSLGYSPNNTFQQYYNHYHCAVLPLYSASINEMSSVFFGGIAQYYDSAGVLVQDNNVPFVKTIARVSRNASGIMAEYKLPIEMPGYLGAGSEFIAEMNLPQYHNGVFKLDEFTSDTTLVGYIYGGINSSAKNIFFINTGTQSIANNQLFKVYVIKNTTVSVHKLNEQSISSLKMQVFPNPNDGNFSVKYYLKKSEKTTLTLFNSEGNKIQENIITDAQVGDNFFSYKLNNRSKGGIYFLSIETPSERSTQKLIIK